MVTAIVVALLGCLLFVVIFWAAAVGIILFIIAVLIVPAMEGIQPSWYLAMPNALIWAIVANALVLTISFFGYRDDLTEDELKKATSIGLFGPLTLALAVHYGLRGVHLLSGEPTISLQPLLFIFLLVESAFLGLLLIPPIGDRIRAFVFTLPSVSVVVRRKSEGTDSADRTVFTLNEDQRRVPKASAMTLEQREARAIRRALQWDQARRYILGQVLLGVLINLFISPELGKSILRFLKETVERVIR